MANASRAVAIAALPSRVCWMRVAMRSVVMLLSVADGTLLMPIRYGCSLLSRYAHLSFDSPDLSRHPHGNRGPPLICSLFISHVTIFELPQRGQRGEG